VTCPDPLYQNVVIPFACGCRYTVRHDGGWWRKNGKQLEVLCPTHGATTLGVWALLIRKLVECPYVPNSIEGPKVPNVR
jgi:hypothetical protein